VKFVQLIDSQKIIKIVATRRHILRLNAPNSISAGAAPQTPMGELTALPRPLLDLRVLLLREGRRGKRVGEGGEGGERRGRRPFW